MEAAIGFLVAAAPILGAAGAGIGALGSIMGGEQQAAVANYQAQVAQQNAVIAQQQANYAVAAGGQQTYNVGLKARAQLGQATANLAAGGVDVNTGSAKQVRETQREVGMEEETTTMQNALLSAYGYKTQATQFEAQSKLYAAEAPWDVFGGVLGAGGTLLSGASTAGYFAGIQNPSYGPTAGATTGGAVGLP